MVASLATAKDAVIASRSKGKVNINE